MGDESASKFLERRAGAFFVGEGAKGADEIAVRNSGGAGWFTGETAEALIEMGEGLLEFEFFFEDSFHEENATPWRVHFLTEFLVGRAGRKAKSTVDAGLNGVGHGLTKRPEFGSVDVVEHGGRMAVF